MKNFLDLAFLIARNSVCLEGKVSCVVVRGVLADVGPCCYPSLEDSGAKIIIATVNSELLRKRGSDCHAEANAVGLCAAKGIPFEGSCAYIIIPPCKTCYILLAIARVKRIVTRAFDESSVEEEDIGIEFVRIKDTEERVIRRETLGRENEDWEKVTELRDERRRLRAALKAKARLNAATSIQTPSV